MKDARYHSLHFLFVKLSGHSIEQVSGYSVESAREDWPTGSDWPGQWQLTRQLLLHSWQLRVFSLYFSMGVCDLITWGHSRLFRNLNFLNIIENGWQKVNCTTYDLYREKTTKLVFELEKTVLRTPYLGQTSSWTSSALSFETSE